MVAKLQPKTPVFLINTRSDELKQYEQIHKKSASLKFGSIKAISKKSVLIVEDIVYMTPKEEQKLRHCLNYDSHHKSIKLFCVSHTIHKTSMFSMLPLFHYLVFTATASNIPVARFTFNFFKLEKPVIQDWLSEFKKRKKPGEYLIMDCSNLKLYGSDNFLETCYFLHDSVPKSGTGAAAAADSDLSGPMTGESERNEKRFEKFFDGHSQRSLAVAVFSVIARSLNSKFLDQKDFTLKFKTRDGLDKKISLVDYIACLLHPSEEPSRDLKVAHNFLQNNEMCVLPKYMIKNAFWRK